MAIRFKRRLRRTAVETTAFPTPLRIRTARQVRTHMHSAGHLRCFRMAVRLQMPILSVSLSQDWELPVQTLLRTTQSRMENPITGAMGIATRALAERSV